MAARLCSRPPAYAVLTKISEHVQRIILISCPEAFIQVVHTILENKLIGLFSESAEAHVIAKPFGVGLDYLILVVVLDFLETLSHIIS